MIEKKEVDNWNANIDICALLERCKHFVLDMDGTFYLSDTIIPGSLHFIEQAKKTGRDFIFFTNNSSKNPENYIDKLAKMDCKIGREQIMTSGDVTIEYLQTNYPEKKVYLVGTEPLVQSFATAGIALVEENPDIVVLGFDQTLTYEKIKNICNFIRAGAMYFATHPDINCPVKGGYIPDVGSFMAMIELSTGSKPNKILGKPYKTTVDMIVHRTGWKKEAIAFVGDRLYTDVATGVNNGAHGLLVLSGESDMHTVQESNVKPDAIFLDLKEIAAYLR
ncbi:HAD-IIA family hydrolase [Treponema phagedenis]|uniref:HAD-IIA family hydrolase n=1 Tax=Treponema phagedenis TaxID=162 RepID=UPI0004AEE6A7|nr:HAD-IIA family hydrolase [Treponema phagedenis]NVP24714.1 HAD-IIA family hydrolase [Treponema phagedenis]QKS92955.1 HAD-IIA family hydrolase [Treponema phagedenis]QLC58906.1 HAD-IIA family hydrolase [Treponema phagedenis]